MAAGLTTDILHDHKLWHEIRTSVLDAVTPLFLELYLGGAHGAIKVLRKQGAKPPGPRKRIGAVIAKSLGIRRPPGFREARRTKAAPNDWTAFLEDPAFAAKAAQYVTIYASDWWNRLEATMRSDLQSVMLEAIDSGQSVADTIPQVAEIFGSARASRIAVTETTRLFGAGAQATYQAVAVQQWDWRGAEDEVMCDLCSEMEDGSPYDMDVDFEPMHPGCRCWPVPTEDSVAEVA